MLMPVGMFALHANCWNYSVIIQAVKVSLRSKWTSTVFWTCLLHLHVLELQLWSNVLSLELVHEMHEMSNHNNLHQILYTTSLIDILDPFGKCFSLHWLNTLQMATSLNLKGELIFLVTCIMYPAPENLNPPAPDKDKRRLSCNLMPCRCIQSQVIFFRERGKSSWTHKQISVTGKYISNFGKTRKHFVDMNHSWTIYFTKLSER